MDPRSFAVQKLLKLTTGPHWLPCLKSGTRSELNLVPRRAGTIFGSWSPPTARSVFPFEPFDEGAFRFAYPVQCGLIIIIPEIMQFSDHAFVKRGHFGQQCSLENCRPGVLVGWVGKKNN